MSHKTLGIGALSKLTGVKIETIRYYERQKLLVDPPSDFPLLGAHGNLDFPWRRFGSYW